MSESWFNHTGVEEGRRQMREELIALLQLDKLIEDKIEAAIERHISRSHSDE